MNNQRKNHIIIKVLLIILALILIAVGCEGILRNSIALEETTIVTIEPKEYPNALRNPLKGFRAPREVFDHEYGTLWRTYIPWNEIENDESDGIDKIKTFCDQYWKDVEKHNIKVIPRVFLDWDGKEGNEYWPADMTTGDYNSEQFRQRLVRLVRRLGQLWDNDPKVAFIEMGIIGYWGEHHNPSISELNGMEDLLGLVFTQAFKNKLVFVRRPMQFSDYEFGVHWDSWAHIQEVETYGGGIAELNDQKSRWQICPIGGECAYNWGRYEQQPGKSPDDTLRDPNHLDWLLYTIRWLHCTELGWVGAYDQNDPVVRASAQKVQKAFGYRFVIDKVSYPANISSNEAFTVSFMVRNVGSAPFYYKWPVEISLLDPKTRIPVWKDTFKDIDIHRWLPGDKWNKDTKSYDLKPKDYQVEGNFQLPQTVESGEYIIALAILDPAGMAPSVRFAIENYFEGGRHPIGLVGIGKMVLNPILDPATFDNPAKDSTLKFELKSQNTPIDLTEPILSLQEAAAIGDVKLVRSLLEKGIEIDSRTNLIKKTALQYAVISGHKDVTELFLDKGADFNRKDENGRTPLFLAVQNNNIDIVKILLDAGADVNAKNKNGQTPLDIILNRSQFQISRNPNHKEIRELLLANGAEIMSIHAAVKSGDLEKVKAFLKQGTDINSKDEDGDTPLHIAVARDNNDITKLLIDNGANVNAGDGYNYTPLYYAALAGNLQVVELLASKGANVNAKSNSGLTPLYAAVSGNYVDIVKFLLSKRADANVSIARGLRRGAGGSMTLIDMAQQRGQTEIVEMLNQHGAKE